MLKGGVIMDVTTPEEARIAEEAGAVAVMALERVPADIRKDGGVARMSDASVIKAIKQAVTIPVMAKARIGHFVEAQILEALDVDYIDESEVSSEGEGASSASCSAVVCCCVRVQLTLCRACTAMLSVLMKGGPAARVLATGHCRSGLQLPKCRSGSQLVYVPCTH
jgi:pyridoxal 5'-phosphate synthase pdxS subunit